MDDSWPLKDIAAQAASSSRVGGRRWYEDEEIYGTSALGPPRDPLVRTGRTVATRLPNVFGCMAHGAAVGGPYQLLEIEIDCGEGTVDVMKG